MVRYTCSVAVTLAAVLASVWTCDGYRIFVAFPFPSKSHSILGNGVVQTLLDAGHEVTYLTPFPMNSSSQLLQHLDVSFAIDVFMSQGPLTMKDRMDNKVHSSDPSLFIEMMKKLNYEVIGNVNVSSFLSDPRHQFDLVIVEWVFSEFLSGLAGVFNCPYIWFSTMEPHWAVLRLVDEVSNPSYVPNALSGALPPYSFLQRLEELWNQLTIYLLTEVYLFKSDKNMYEKIYGPIVAKRGNQLPPYEDLRYNASLMLGNSHVSLGQAISLPQSYIPIGGYHIDPDVKPLPKDLMNLINNSKHGVIYFSMGSNVKSKDFPEEVKSDLLQMFGQLKQTVIWKLEDVLPNLPKNVHIMKWVPQQSILSHPHCVLFITHGGLLSTMEAVHFGVPIIGVPVFGDQFNNVDRAVSRGFAKRVDLSYNIARDLKTAIEDIIKNPAYSVKVKELSTIYHERSVPPRRELTHWVTLVASTRGVPHLRSPALMLPWYQKIYLDLILLIVFIITCFIFVVKRLFCTHKLNKKKKNN